MRPEIVKRFILPIMKFALAAGIIGWLVYNIDAEQLAEVRRWQIDWSTLFAGFVCCFGAVTLTFVRWRMLVRAINIPFSIADAFRLGFLGYLLNFVSVGLVGGDLFKAVFIARQCPGRRAEAVATVMVDRVFGLYALLVVTSIAVLLSDFSDSSTAVATICNSTLLATAIGAVGIGLLMTPGLTGPRIVAIIESVPLVGKIGGRLVSAIGLYRKRPGVLLASGLLSLIVHATLATGVYLAARSLFPAAPTLAEHLVIVPLSLVAGALPFTPAGLGAFEAAMEQLSSIIPLNPSGSDGLIVALVYRLITICIAAVGGVYYVIGRKEVAQVLEEAEHEPEKETSENTDRSSDSDVCARQGALG